MFGSTLDVAAGLLLLFLVSSLMASAVVEAVGGFFHRRAKYLWDSLLLLLHPTATAERASSPASPVNSLYSGAAMAGLVRPTDRLRFDPANPFATDGRQRSGPEEPWAG